MRFRQRVGVAGISIHSLLAEGDEKMVGAHRDQRISIHSLLAEGDFQCRNPVRIYANFNPLPPRGGRLWPRCAPAVPALFQSTPSSRRETPRAASARKRPKNFNPLPPRGGRLLAVRKAQTPKIFQSTPSSRRETREVGHDRKFCRISIHSLLAEGDGRRKAGARFYGDISIHSLLAEGDGRR